MNVWNPNYAEIQKEGAFGTTYQLSEIWTGHPHNITTFKCYLLSIFPPPSLEDGGSGLKKLFGSKTVWILNDVWNRNHFIRISEVGFFKFGLFGSIFSAKLDRFIYNSYSIKNGLA